MEKLHYPNISTFLVVSSILTRTVEFFFFLFFRLSLSFPQKVNLFWPLTGLRRTVRSWHVATKEVARCLIKAWAYYSKEIW